MAQSQDRSPRSSRGEAHRSRAPRHRKPCRRVQGRRPDDRVRGQQTGSTGATRPSPCSRRARAASPESARNVIMTTPSQPVSDGQHGTRLGGPAPSREAGAAAERCLRTRPATREGLRVPEIRVGGSLRLTVRRDADSVRLCARTSGGPAVAGDQNSVSSCSKLRDAPALLLAKATNVTPVWGLCQASPSHPNTWPSWPYHSPSCRIPSP